MFFVIVADRNFGWQLIFVLFAFEFDHWSDEQNHFVIDRPDGESYTPDKNLAPLYHYFENQSINFAAVQYCLTKFLWYPFFAAKSLHPVAIVVTVVVAQRGDKLPRFALF